MTRLILLACALLSASCYGSGSPLVVQDPQPAIRCSPRGGANAWVIQEVESGCVMLNFGIEGASRYPEVEERDVVLRDFGWVGVSCAQLLADPDTARGLVVAESVTGWISRTGVLLNVSLDGDFRDGRIEEMRIADLDPTISEGIVECAF